MRVIGRRAKNGSVEIDLDHMLKNSVHPDQTAENDRVDLDQTAENGKWCRPWSYWEWQVV